ncbi:hypothetical protein HY837_02975 [archaeon]|nr:hypothetical protein [archaeon]
MDKTDLVIWGFNTALFGGYFVYELFQARNINEARDAFLKRSSDLLKDRSIMDGAWDFYITRKVTGPFTYFAKKKFKEEVLK